MIAVIGGLKLEQHEINGSIGGSDEEDFHASVVDGDEVGDQVQIACREDEREQNL